MGILNITPDSFSDGGAIYGSKNHIDNALKKVEEMINDGASIIDVGGESTRPGYVQVSDDEEIYRVCPIIEKINDNFDVVVSVDTYKSKVAKEAVSAGAHMINDIWGFKADRDMASIVALNNLSCCIMHNRDLENNPYTSFYKDIFEDLKESVEIALSAGVKEDKIIIDPGIGFGKSYEQNLDMISNIEVLHPLGLPILLGTSRKSVIGLTLNLPVDEREEGTMATTTFGVLKGCSIIRVHDVKKNYRAAKMALELRRHMRDATLFM